MQSLSVMMRFSSVYFAVDTDLIKVCLIHTDLSEFRSGDDHFSKIRTDAMNLCELCDIQCGILYDSVTV